MKKFFSRLLLVILPLVPIAIITKMAKDEMLNYDLLAGATITLLIFGIIYLLSPYWDKFFDYLYSWQYAEWHEKTITAKKRR